MKNAFFRNSANAIKTFNKKVPLANMAMVVKTLRHEILKIDLGLVIRDKNYLIKQSFTQFPE